MKWILSLIIAMISMVAFGAEGDVSSEAPAMADQILGFISPFITGYAAQYPWIVTIAVVMGVIRAILKPLMSLVWAIVEQTKTEVDNEIYNKVVGHVVWKWFAYILDWMFSLKLPKK